MVAFNIFFISPFSSWFFIYQYILGVSSKVSYFIHNGPDEVLREMRSPLMKHLMCAFWKLVSTWPGRSFPCSPEFYYLVLMTQCANVWLLHRYSAIRF